MARGRKHVRSGQKRKHRDNRGEKLSKKQRTHIREFGEIHPSEEKNPTQERFHKVEDRPALVLPEPEAKSSSESEAGDEESSAYQKLISSLGAQQDLDSDEEEDDDEEDLSNEENDGNSEDDEEAVGDADQELDTEEDSDEENDLSNQDAEHHGEDEEEEEVGEEEEGGEQETDSEEEREKQDHTLIGTDPFTQHFVQDLEEKEVEKLADKNEWARDGDIKLPNIGRCTIVRPRNRTQMADTMKEKDLKKLHVKHSLCRQVKTTNDKFTKTHPSSGDYLNHFQHSLFSVLNTYQDVYYPERSCDDAEGLRLVYCLHALNHALKTRSRVIAHNSKIKSKQEDLTDDYRDQGLTRPKVLMVVPFRESAYQIVQHMINLLMPADQSIVSSKKRFKKEFGSEQDEKKGYKPEDFEAFFTGNIDDHFHLGIGIGKKSLKLFTEIYASDIVIASPLGLRTLIGADGDSKRNYDFLSSIEMLILDQTDIFLMQNWDHVLHLMDHMHLQPKESHGVDFSRVRLWTLNGWAKYYRQTLIFSHVVTPEINSIFNKHCNSDSPTEEELTVALHRCGSATVDLVVGQVTAQDANCEAQTSHSLKPFHTWERNCDVEPDIESCNDFAGKIQVNKARTTGTICQVVCQLPQVFQRVEAQSFAQLPDARLEFFKKKVLPQYKDALMSHTLVFVSSYFDFVRLRNFFKKEEINFAQSCEYTKDKTLSRARSNFYHGKVHFLLFTERLHFYHRYKLRGIRHLVFYDLPTYSHYYSELCNMVQDHKRQQQAQNCSCTAIYSKYDIHKLAAIVGTDRATHMVNAEKSIHMLVTGET